MAPLFKTILRSIVFFGYCLTLRAATGDVTVTIEPNGAFADVAVAGFTSAATYAFGLGTNNVPGANTPYFTVVSMGFDDTGSATTITRKVYLTRNVVFPFGSKTFLGTYTSGTFTDGELVTQGVSGATGYAVGAQSSGTALIMKGIVGSPLGVSADTWVGGSSGAIFAPQTGDTGTTITLPKSDEKVQTGPNLIARIALSDYIYQKDNTGGGNSGTAPTFTAPSGFIVNSGGASQNSNVASAISVTQNSTLAYQATIANWSRPGLSLAQGTTLRLGVVAFHNSAQKGRPVRDVKFVVSDAHSHTQTVHILSATYDSTYGDAIPVVEYIADVSTGTFTALDALTCNFTAYPWIGDSGASTTSAGTQPTPLPAPETFVCDTATTYGQTWACVSTTGSDSGANTVYDQETTPYNPTNAAAAYKFLTIGKAAAAIGTYNNANHSRNDLGGGTVYVGAGTFAFTGSSNTYGGGNSSVWFTLTADTANGATQSTAIIGSGSNNTTIRDRMLWSNLTITAANGADVIHGANYVWIDNCVINTAHTDFFDTNPIIYVTRSTITQLAQGLRPFSTQNNAFALVRGNTFNGFAKAICPWTVLGNSKTTVSAADGITLQPVIVGSTQPVPQNIIIAYNSLLGCFVNGSPILGSSFNTTTLTTGMALVQNIFENVYHSGASALISIAADGSTPGSTSANNVLWWHNLVTGQRQNTCYNDTTTNAPARSNWSFKNNAWENVGIKTDTFATANSLRVANWPEVYATGYTGNVDGEITGIGSATIGSGFPALFSGINCYMPAVTYSNQPPTLAAVNVLGWMQFVNRASSTGAADGSGLGNYRVYPSSPLINMQLDWLLPYDISGQVRGPTSEASVYGTQFGQAAAFVAQ